MQLNILIVYCLMKLGLKIIRKLPVISSS